MSVFEFFIGTRIPSLKTRLPASADPLTSLIPTLARSSTTSSSLEWTKSSVSTSSPYRETLSCPGCPDRWYCGRKKRISSATSSLRRRRRRRKWTTKRKRLTLRVWKSENGRILWPRRNAKSRQRMKRLKRRAEIKMSSSSVMLYFLW